jgi:uncharacterized protein (TIGR02594 family)
MTTLYDLATRYVGIRELAGQEDHPLILWWLSLCFDGNLKLHDEVPWCSAFMNGMAWGLRLPRSKSAMARSWLNVGRAIPLVQARPGYDVAVLWRESRTSPFGHVGLVAGIEDRTIQLLAGNQGNAVSVAPFPIDRVIGVRRLFEV